MWIANIAAGNNGNGVHMAFWRFSQATALIAVLQLVFTFLANSSYGTYYQVYTALSAGMTVTYTAPVSTAAATFVSAGTATATTTGAYILYKGTALTTSATDYTFGGMSVVNTFDSNANTSLYLNLASGVLDLALIGLSWMPFSAHYTYLNFQATVARDAYGCDIYGYNYGVACTYGYTAAATTSAYNAYGCNAYGQDAYGNACPASL